MSDPARDACITGIGIVSSLGEGPQAHWQQLMQGSINVDAASFAPFTVHPLSPIDFDSQIPKKGDLRQMDSWQRIGTYAAGLALDSAGIKGNSDILGRTDMIVAAGGGERDLTADSGILAAISGAENSDAVLNARLMSDLRPTLFLAQLSNLLAGNISIVHGVTGSSRTFMGEESSGIDAVRIACARINSGQSDVGLIGGSFNAERKDMMLLCEFGNTLHRGPHLPLWERAPRGGMMFGSMGAFLVIESRAHAESRGAKVLARISAVLSDRSRRDNDPVAPALRRMWTAIAPRIRPAEAAILSGASGVEPATTGERAFLSEHADLPIRATGTAIGHGLEPQLPINIALATVALGHATLFPPQDASGLERPAQGNLRQVIVTGVGHWRGEGLALVEAP